MKIKQIFSFFLFFLISTEIVFAADKIVFLDLNFILSNSDRGKKLLNELRVMDEKNRTVFKKDEIALENKQKKIKSLENVVSENEYKSKVSNFRAEVENFRVKKKKIIDKFEVKKKTELDSFFMSLNKILTEYMESNSIDLILDKKNIIVSTSGRDISNEILLIVDKKLK